MLDFSLYLTLFAVGLLGSTHCMGMCGGLQQLFVNMSPSQSKTVLLTYHLGRISSYAIMAFLVSFLFTQFAEQTKGLVPYVTVVRLLAAVVILWLGITHFIHLPLPHYLTIATDKLWQSIRRIASPLLPPKNIIQVFCVGMVWGWLPCSLVYSALAIALSANSPLNSTLAMLCFGLGTMPALLGIGIISQHLQKQPKYRDFLAGFLIIIGLYAFISVWL